MVAQTMVTQQTATLGCNNSCQMAAVWSTLVMNPTLWLVPTFGNVTMGHGIQVFLHARVSSFHGMIYSWSSCYPSVTCSFTFCATFVSTVWLSRTFSGRQKDWKRLFPRTNCKIWVHCGRLQFSRQSYVDMQRWQLGFREARMQR